MPIDAGALRADLLVVHAYKSMLSNYGLGFAVLGDRFADGRPHEESWLVRRGAEDFSRLVDYQDDYAAGMRRYDTSLRANPVLIRMLEAASGLLLEWRPERIREYLLGISRDAVARLRAAGFGVADEDLRAANVFGVHLPGGLAAEGCRAELARRRVHVSVRGDAVRVSPHVYNDAQDLARLADALIEVGGR
jgi:selenocysteine lyase/cysteine desulfurase